MFFFHFLNLIDKWTKQNQNINLIVSKHFSSIKMSIHVSKYGKKTFYVKKSKCPIHLGTSCPIIVPLFIKFTKILQFQKAENANRFYGKKQVENLYTIFSSDSILLVYYR